MIHICEEGNHQHTLPAVLYQKLFQVTVDEVGNWSHKKSPSLTLIFFFAQNKLGPGISLLLLQAFFLNEYAWYLCYHNAEKILWLFTTMKTLLQKMLDRLLWPDKLHMRSVIQDILVTYLTEKTSEDFLQTKRWSGERIYQLKIYIIVTDKVKGNT